MYSVQVFVIISLTLFVQVAQSFSLATPSTLSFSVGTRPKTNIRNDPSIQDDNLVTSRRNPTFLYATKKSTSLYYRDGIEYDEADILQQFSSLVTSSSSLPMEQQQQQLQEQSSLAMTSTSKIPDIEIPRHYYHHDEQDEDGQMTQVIYKISSNKNILDSLEISLGRVAMIVAFVFCLTELQTGLSISEQIHKLF